MVEPMCVALSLHHGVSFRSAGSRRRQNPCGETPSALLNCSTDLEGDESRKLDNGIVVKILLQLLDEPFVDCVGPERDCLSVRERYALLVGE